MTATILKDYKSKGACPRCSEKKLYNNDSEKVVPVVHYHCLNCGYQFFETEEQREISKKKADEKKDGQTSNPMAFTLIVLILATALALVVSRENESQDAPVLEPSSRLEQLNRGARDANV